jgi:hypothetical protein
MDGEILLGGVDGVMAHHLFDLINRVTQVEKILGIGVAQGVGGSREPCSLHGFGNGLTDTGGLHRLVREHEPYKKMSGWALGPGL